MQLGHYSTTKKGRPVWMSRAETEKFIACGTSELSRQVMRLLSFGLRVSEVRNLNDGDLINRDGCYWLIIRKSKTGYRENPASSKVESYKFPLVSQRGTRLSTRQMQRYVIQTGKVYAQQYPEDIDEESKTHKALYIRPHDFRRSAATQLLTGDGGEPLDPNHVKTFLGWKLDSTVFLNHYITHAGIRSSPKITDERSKNSLFD